jgi:hypothetical protein
MPAKGPGPAGRERLGWLADLLRDPQVSGSGKALWVLVLILPLLGCLIYLVARGSGMQARAIESRQELVATLTGPREADGKPASHPPARES